MATVEFPSFYDEHRAYAAYERPQRHKEPPKRAVRSFDNLVALANDAERIGRDARKLVWRDRGELPIELRTMRECLRHALRGGLRAGALAFGIRVGVNLFLLLFRIMRVPKHFRVSLLRRAVFGEDSFRFGAMLGTFVGLYKYLLNALPILDRNLNKQSPLSPIHSHPFDDDDDSEELEDGNGLTIGSTRIMRRLSTKGKAHQEWVHKRTKRWHAVVAGAVAGAAGLMFEKKRRRVNIAQQLFVRGLQATYNEFSVKHNFKVPFGPVIVFSLCSGQIMYGWLLRPDTIPRGYSEWIQTASKTIPQTIKLHRDRIRTGKYDLADMEFLLNWPGLIHPLRPILAAELERASTMGDFGPPYASCAAVHPWIYSCKAVPLDRFLSVFKWMLPIYGALHFIPMLLFKRSQVFRQPREMLSRVLFGTARSSTFLGAFVVIYQTFFCAKHNLYAYLASSSSSLHIPKFLIDLLVSKFSYWVGGLLSGLSLFIEARHRRPELAMYVLPKGLESAWKVASGKGFVWGPRKYGEAALCAMGMGMVMNAYQHNPEHLSGLVRRILYQFIGPN